VDKNSKAAVHARMEKLNCDEFLIDSERAKFLGTSGREALKKLHLLML
jgi:hypothetical protein